MKEDFRENSREGNVIINKITNDNILDQYTVLKMNDLESSDLMRRYTDAKDQLALLESKLYVKKAERNIAYKKMWDEVYKVYPHSQSYNRLQVKEEDTHLCIVAPPDQRQSGFPFPFPPQK